jgi:hypothetical protein
MDPLEMSVMAYWEKFPSHVPLREARTPQEHQLRLLNVFNEESGCIPTGSLVGLGQRMAVFPATETACERLFCHIRNLIGDFRQAMTTDTIRLLVRIRLHHLWNADDTHDVPSVTSRLRGGVDDESALSAVHIESE